jgi:hypothetical protein
MAFLTFNIMAGLQRQAFVFNKRHKASALRSTGNLPNQTAHRGFVDNNSYNLLLPTQFASRSRKSERQANRAAG